jgi:hypothetical protein
LRTWTPDEAHDEKNSRVHGVVHHPNDDSRTEPSAANAARLRLAQENHRQVEQSGFYRKSIVVRQAPSADFRIWIHADNRPFAR